jgi:putative SOS response-associated peptidase YedK
MCGRFTLTRRDGNLLAAELGVDTDDIRDWRPRYNVAPTQRHYIVTSQYERRHAEPARWGLVNSWARDNSRASMTINAKSETVELKPTFRAAFKKRRCVVPADGFYEWTGPKAKRVPKWIHRRDGKLLLFAGLYESWFPEKDKPEQTFTIITCDANATIAAIHNRMPVILSDRDAEDWMNPAESNPISLKRLLVPASDDLLDIQTASTLANSTRNDGPELLEADPA